MFSMIGGQNDINNYQIDNDMNPQKEVVDDKKEMKAQQGEQIKISANLFKTFHQQQHVLEQKLGGDKNIIEQFQSKDHEMEIQCEVNQIQGDNDESRPSPIDESCSNSNNSKIKTKPTPLSNQLIRLTKKATTSNCRKQKKIRYYVTDFQPYLPSFLDQLHREHHKNIIRVGQQYQANIDPSPRFQSLHRSMGHLRVWKGNEECFDEQVFKKFKQIYGEYRNEEQLILLKNRLKADTWADVMKELNQQKQQGKKQTLHIPNNNMNGASTRIK